MSGSTALAAAALIEAQHANDVATCMPVLRDYHPSVHTTVATMQHYAACVDTVYPTPSDIPTWAIKVCILICLFGSLIGAVYFYRDNDKSFLALGFGAFVGAVVAALVTLLVAVAVYSIYYLFT